MAGLVCPSCGEVAVSASARFCEGCQTPLRADLVEAKPVSLANTKGCRCATPEFDADGYCQACGLKMSLAPTPAPLEYEQTVDARLAVASDRGRRHPTNQDFGAVARRSDGAVLLVVADGVSTSDNAEGASRAAVEAALRAFLAGPAGEASLGAEAKACVAAAARAVLATPVIEREYDDGPASTIAVAIARNQGGVIANGVAWVGDSRVYLVAAGVPETLLTRDDSWREDEVEAGRASFAEAARHPNAHAITQWLGMAPEAMTIHVKETAATAGGALLICSDGLWNYVDAPTALARVYTQAAADADAATLCGRLVAFANAAGGSDNITVALLML